MEWLNIHRSTVEGEAMQDASAAAVRAWLFLNTYCAGQENGGRIEGARGWNDRKWLKQCGLNHEEVDQASTLWRWEGNDLLVEFYPVEQEAKVKKQRRGGSIGGKKRVENARRHQGQPETKLEGEVQGNLEGQLEGEVQRKGREGKEKKGKGKKEDALSDEVLVPSEAEVRTWAEMSDVDPEFAVQKWAATSEAHGWCKNGELIDWQGRFGRYWKEDQVEWQGRQKKNRAQKNGAGNLSLLTSSPTEKPAGWKEGDQSWWWTEGLELIEKALTGALLGGDPVAERLREIFRVRKEN